MYLHHPLNVGVTKIFPIVWQNNQPLRFECEDYKGLKSIKKKSSNLQNHKIIVNKLTTGWETSFFRNSSLKLRFPLVRDRTLPFNSLTWSNFEVLSPVRDDLAGCSETKKLNPGLCNRNWWLNLKKRTNNIAIVTYSKARTFFKSKMNIIFNSLSNLFKTNRNG